MVNGTLLQMAEGANHGCPLSDTLDTLVLGEVLCPLDMAMKVRMHKRFSEKAIDNSDDGAEDETHPMGYIDNVVAAIPHVDVPFFFEEFNRLGWPFGLYLNPPKTRILISTSGACSLSRIGEEYGLEICSRSLKSYQPLLN